jgi:hypothetical protein
MRASRADTVQDNFGLANAPPTGGGFPRGNGNIEPLNVFDGAALIADKVMVPVKVGVVARGFALPRHFPYGSKLRKSRRQWREPVCAPGIRARHTAAACSVIRRAENAGQDCRECRSRFLD